MKATIDIPDALYRRVKAKSALEGRAVREVTITLFHHWVKTAPAPQPESADEPSCPPWFGSLRRYAARAGGRHEMDAVRESIARGRAGKASA